KGTRSRRLWVGASTLLHEPGPLGRCNGLLPHAARTQYAPNCPFWLNTACSHLKHHPSVYHGVYPKQPVGDLGSLWCRYLYGIYCWGICFEISRMPHVLSA